MSKNVASFEEFCKMGTSEIVKAHYSDVKVGDDNHETVKAENAIVKGNGNAEHTEEVKAEDLADPKIQPKKI